MYPGTLPPDYENLTHDQLYLLIWDRKRLLKQTGDPVKGTSSELRSLGALPKNYRSGKSVARELMESEERERQIEGLESTLPAQKGLRLRQTKRAIRALKREHKRLESERRDRLGI